MTELTTAWMLGCVCGFFMGVTVAGRRRPTCRELMRDRDRQPTFAELLLPPPRDRDPDWRRSINHENTNRPSGPPPLLYRPATPKPDIIPKPQPPPGRIIDASGRTIGYFPLPWDGSTNPPPRNP